MAELMTSIGQYWTRRAPSYTDVINKNLSDGWDQVWAEELISHFPAHDGALRVLDIGTGPGFYAIILARRGYCVTAIDYSEGMLSEAMHNAGELADSIEFLHMDAQNLEFADDSFDVIVTRNLTWNLPSPIRAYEEWRRVLRPGGVLLNFDANYGDNVRHNRQRDSYIEPTEVYGHCGVTPELERENAEITLSMPISRKQRPEWDRELLLRCGFAACEYDREAGRRVLREHDLEDAPLFLLAARVGE